MADLDTLSLTVRFIRGDFFNLYQNHTLKPIHMAFPSTEQIHNNWWM